MLSFVQSRRKQEVGEALEVVLNMDDGKVEEEVGEEMRR